MAYCSCIEADHEMAIGASVVCERGMAAWKLEMAEYSVSWHRGGGSSLEAALFQALLA